MSDTSHSIFRSASRFFLGTLLSRFSGLLRDVSMAFFFGSSPSVAAFMVAYRLANLFRRLFGEGNLPAGFIPHFEALRAKRPKDAILFYRDVSFSLLIVLIFATGGMEAALWFLSGFLSPEWKEISRLAMWMAPGLIFICLYGLNSSLLQCNRRFFLSAAAPLAFNSAWIGFAFFQDISLLAVGITLAFGLQWLATSFMASKYIFAELTLKEWLQPKLFSTSWKGLIKPLSLSIVGVGAMQINSALDAVFARVSDLSGPAYLWYAIRVQQLPLALFGIALSGALLPPLARAMQRGDLGVYRELLRGALRQAAALLIPCTFGLFVLGKGGISLLYRHGNFTEDALSQTLLCLWGYGAGLVPAGFVLLLAGGFYAKKSYFIPFIASVSSVLFNVICNMIFVFGLNWGAQSIAISTSASSFFNVLILTYFLQREMGPVHSFSTIGRLILCSLGAAFIAGFSSESFFIQAPVYIASGLVLAKLLGEKEIFILAGILKNKGSSLSTASSKD